MSDKIHDPDSRAEPIFNGLAGESIQAFVDRFGNRRHGESEHEFCERRGREAEERARRNDAMMRPCADPRFCATGPSVQDGANRSSDGRY